LIGSHSPPSGRLFGPSSLYAGVPGLQGTDRIAITTWEGDEHEIFRLQDRTTLIPVVRKRTLTLIKREDDTMS
jgi:hypothetical protein